MFGVWAWGPGVGPGAPSGCPPGEGGLGQLQAVCAGSNPKAAFPKVGRPGAVLGVFENSVNRFPLGGGPGFQVRQLGATSGHVRVAKFRPAHIIVGAPGSRVFNAKALEGTGGGPGAVASVNFLLGGQGGDFDGHGFRGVEGRFFRPM